MNEITPYEADIQRIERFQTFQSGQYWRAMERIDEEGIDVGMVLLINSIRWVDDKPHTVILRAHPALYEQKVKRTIIQSNGDTREIWILYDEHRFLVDDFLAKFEFEPNHARIRNEEIQRVQGRINALQTDLLEAQSDPSILAQVVQEQLIADLPAESQQDGARALTTISQNDQSMVTGTVANVIGAGITEQSVAALKAAAGREHQIATIRSKWIQGKASSIAETIQALTPFYAEQAAAALAQTDDIRSYVSKLMAGIESLDLYVGKGVIVDTVCKGGSAPRSLPLTFVQRKLMMDEELAVWLDLDAWFDFSRTDLFFESLRKHKGLIDQIFPTERCVLVMATTIRNLDYGDAWINQARNAENAKVFLLVRDGENVYCVKSPVETHLKSERLFPSRTETDSIFKGLDASTVKFQDVAYTDKLANHELCALHYKRFLLLACGLDHRLKLFGDFYEGPATLDFVSLRFQDMYCRFLHDDDGWNSLPGEVRQPVEKWIETKNSMMGSGSRVLCNWNGVMQPDTAPGAVKTYRGSKGKSWPYKPSENAEVVIAYKDGKSICVDAQVSGSTAQGQGRSFSCKVDLSALKTSSWQGDDLAYLCLDDVQAQDLDWYIHSRNCRRGHLSYIRFFKLAQAYVTAEILLEAPARKAIAEDLAYSGLNEKGIEATVQNTVVTWRAVNRGKALPNPNVIWDAVAWKSVVQQSRALAGASSTVIGQVEDFVRNNGRIALRLVVDGSARMVVYTTPSIEERNDCLEPHAWSLRMVLREGKKGISVASQKWVILPKQSTSETPRAEWPLASDWIEKKSAFKSLAQKIDAFAKIEQRWAQREHPVLSAFLTRSATEEVFRSMLTEWKNERAKLLKKSRFVKNPHLVIPIGVYVRKVGESADTLFLSNDCPHALLHHMAPSYALKNEVRESFIRDFSDKTYAKKKFSADVADEYPWKLACGSLDLLNPNGSDIPYSDASKLGTIGTRPKLNPLLDDWIGVWTTSVQNNQGSVWTAPGLMNEQGKVRLDDVFDQKLPFDYCPTEIVSTNFDKKAGVKYDTWHDIFPVDVDQAETFNDYEKIDLYESFYAKHGKMGRSCQTSQALTYGQAIKFMQHKVRDAALHNLVLVSSVDVPDAPQPPTGVERWFLVDSAQAV